jgi:predicted dehydrogenase
MKPIPLAIVGGQRGGAFGAVASALGERVALVAICDTREEVLTRWREQCPGLATFTDYDRMLEESGCRAVVVATPLPLHAEQSMRAMRAGMDVLSEVTAAQTLEECWALVETVERTGRTYMMAENACYTRENMAILRLVQEGRFGETYYAEGAYLHDCSDLLVDQEGRLTWRGALRRDKRGNWYPTHSLGPPAQWLGTTGGSRDRLASTATFACGGPSVERYLAHNLPATHPLREVRFAMANSSTTLITTAQGKVIALRVDWASRRPHNTAHYALQGLTGAYLSGRGPGEESLIWMEGESPASPTGVATTWESFSARAKSFDHPLWQQWGGLAGSAGHGGSDFFVLLEFITAIEEGRRPAVDVYDAAAWSAITPLSEESLARGGAPVEIPDFRRGRSSC